MSGLTELPSTLPTSLGGDKEDRILYANEAWRAQAFLLNKIRTYLIQMGEMLGLGDGTTPGSLQARVNALETALANPVPQHIFGCANTVVSLLGVETRLGGIGAFDPAAYAGPNITFDVQATFGPATTGTAVVRLYDIGTRATPTAGDLRCTMTLTVLDGGVARCVSTPLTPVAVPGVNNGQIYDSERVYEIRGELVGATAGDALEVTNAGLTVIATALGGTTAPMGAAYVTLGHPSGLPNHRGLVGSGAITVTDSGAGGTVEVALRNAAGTPPADAQYATDGSGTPGWYPKPPAPATALFTWNGVDTSQFAAPVLFGGALSAQLLAIPDPSGSGATVLQIRLPNGTPAGGGAFFPVIAPASFQSMYVRLMTFQDSSPGWGVTAPDQLAVGWGFGYDAAVGTGFGLATLMNPGAATDTILCGISDGFGTPGSIAGTMSAGSAAFRITELTFNGSLVPVMGGDEPAFLGQMRSVGFGVAGELVGLAFANPTFPGYGAAWPAAAKNRLGLAITAPVGLVNNASMLLSYLSIAPFPHGTP